MVLKYHFRKKILKKHLFQSNNYSNRRAYGEIKIIHSNQNQFDETLQIGDIIWLSENEDLNNANKGFLSKYEWEVAGTNDFGVEECKTYHLLVINGCEMVVKNKSCL